MLLHYIFPSLESRNPTQQNHAPVYKLESTGMLTALHPTNVPMAKQANSIGMLKNLVKSPKEGRLL